MKKQLMLVVLGLVLVLLAAGQLARAAGEATPPPAPQDTAPSFSADARYVAYAEQRGQTWQAWLAPAGGGNPRQIGLGQPRGFRPGSNSELLVQIGNTTTVETTSGTPVTAFIGDHPSWSPDGGNIAYLVLNDLYVVDAASAHRRIVATGIDLPSWDQTGPVWSPDGKQVVVASGSSLLLVNVDGSGSRVLFTGANQSVNPAWSPDGTTIAFERNAGAHWSIWTVAPDGSNARQLLGGDANYRYPRYSPNGALAFISDKQHLRGGATQYQFALYTLDSGGGGGPRERVADVHPYSPPAWSPTGAQLAVAAGGECMRWGIDVVRSDAYPLNAHRRSNVCRLNGTARADTLHGTPWLDIVRGFGGNDVIHGGAGNDRIEGDSGDDAVYGGAGNDAIFGGPGNDRIFGGPGNDLIIPGNGHDIVDCGPGNDIVEGAGSLDRIAKSCEHVRH